MILGRVVSLAVTALSCAVAGIVAATAAAVEVFRNDRRESLILPVKQFSPQLFLQYPHIGSARE